MHKNPPLGGFLFFVPPCGIEPQSSASKAEVLSVERQGQHTKTILL